MPPTKPDPLNSPPSSRGRHFFHPASHAKTPGSSVTHPPPAVAANSLRRCAQAFIASSELRKKSPKKGVTMSPVFVLTLKLLNRLER